MNIYVTADTHFDHKNIIKYENRPFQDELEMTEVLIERWNRRVKPDDIIFHLGDVFISNAKRAEEISKRLNGRKHLIIGNHDHFTKTKYEKMGFKVHNYYFLEDYLLSHYPQDATGLQIAQSKGLLKKNIHGHVHSKTGELDSSVHMCVSVELTDYQPVSFEFLKQNSAHWKM